MMPEVHIIGGPKSGKTTLATVIRHALENAGLRVDVQEEDEAPQNQEQRLDAFRGQYVTLRQVHARRPPPAAPAPTPEAPRRKNARVGAVRVVPVMGGFRVEEIVSAEGYTITWDELHGSVENARQFLRKRGYKFLNENEANIN